MQIFANFYSVKCAKIFSKPDSLCIRRKPLVHMDVWAPICSWIFHANSPFDLRRMKLVIFCMYSFWYEFNTPHLTIINQTTITSRSFTREKRQAYSLCEAIGEFSAGEGVSVDAWLSVCICLARDLPLKNAGLKGADEARWLHSSTERVREGGGRREQRKPRMRASEREKKETSSLKGHGLSAAPSPSACCVSSSHV